MRRVIQMKMIGWELIQNIRMHSSSTCIPPAAFTDRILKFWDGGGRAYHTCHRRGYHACHTVPCPPCMPPFTTHAPTFGCHAGAPSPCTPPLPHMPHFVTHAMIRFHHPHPLSPRTPLHHACVNKIPLSCTPPPPSPHTPLSCEQNAIQV